MPHPEISRRRWFILAVIFAAVVLNYFDRQIVSILKPTLKETFTMDDRGYALVVNVFTVCYATMYPVAGWLADRFGARAHARGHSRLVDGVPVHRPDHVASPVDLLSRHAGAV